MDGWKRQNGNGMVETRHKTVIYLCKDARMPVEEILVEYWVVVGQRLGETG